MPDLSFCQQSTLGHLWTKLSRRIAICHGKSNTSIVSNAAGKLKNSRLGMNAPAFRLVIDSVMPLHSAAKLIKQTYLSYHKRRCDDVCMPLLHAYKNYTKCLLWHALCTIGVTSLHYEDLGWPRWTPFDFASAWIALNIGNLYWCMIIFLRTTALAVHTNVAGEWHSCWAGFADVN